MDLGLLKNLYFQIYFISHFLLILLYVFQKKAIIPCRFSFSDITHYKKRVHIVPLLFGLKVGVKKKKEIKQSEYCEATE